MNLCSIVLCLSHQRRRLPEPLLPFCTAWALLIKTWFHDAERNHNSFLTNKETVSSCKSSHAETNNCFKQEKISSQSSLARIHEKHRSTLSVPDEDDELLSDLDTGDPSSLVWLKFWYPRRQRNSESFTVHYFIHLPFIDACWKISRWN